jgi:hypothetical protein
MRTHPDEALTIEGVARTVGLSVRALHAGPVRWSVYKIVPDDDGGHR